MLLLDLFFVRNPIMIISRWNHFLAAILIVGVLAHESIALSVTPHSALKSESIGLNNDSPSYVDFSQRLNAKARTNSIALLMLVDSLRGGHQDTQNMIDILNDHKEQVSGVESFRNGRHSFSFKGDLRGELEPSKLVQTFSVFGGKIRGNLDFEIIRRDRELIPTHGRIQQQTEIDYVISKVDLETKACGTVAADIQFPGLKLGSGLIGASSQFCYEYQPSKMTALAQYVAKNQQRLASLELGQGEDFDYITEQLYLHSSSNCSIYTVPNPQECETIKVHLDALHEARLGLDIPSEVKSLERLRSEFRKDITNRFFLEDSKKTRQRIKMLENFFGRKLTKMEAQIIDLVAGTQSLQTSFNSIQVEQLRQGKLLEYLSESKVRATIIVKAMRRAQEKLQQEQEVLKEWSEITPYAQLPAYQKKIKFVEETKRINQTHEEIRLYSHNLENTLVFIGALSGSPSFQEDVKKAFAVINNINELIKVGRSLKNAHLAGMLTNTATIASFSNGISAAITLISLFSGAGGQSELQAVRNYLGQRLDVIDEKLNILIDQSVQNSRKLDFLLNGQRVITEFVLQNSRGIQATRVEIALLNQAIQSLDNKVLGLYQEIKRHSKKQAQERSKYFDEYATIERNQSLRPVKVVLANWLNPDSKIIKRLNKGNFDQNFLDKIRADRQKVIQLIEDLIGPEFIYSSNILASGSRLHDRPPSDLISMLPGYAKKAVFLTTYDRNRYEPKLDEFVWMRDQETSEIKSLHDQAYPLVDAKVFENLPNPDVLTHILKEYLTFVLALNDEARKTVGFGDLSQINKLISSLSASRKAAQNLTWPLFSAARKSLILAEKELGGYLDGGLLLKQRRHDIISSYVFSSNALDFSKRFQSEQEQAEFRARISEDKHALDWLITHGSVYLKRIGISDGTSELAIMKNLIDTPETWMLRPSEAGFEWLQNWDRQDVIWFHSKVLANIRALYDAYITDELFEFTDNELVFLDTFVKMPTSQMTRNDLKQFIKLIKSDKQLLKLAEDQELIHLKLNSDNTKIDANSGTEGLASPYAIVEYITIDPHNADVLFVVNDPNATVIMRPSEGRYEFHSLTCLGVRLSRQQLPNSFNVYLGPYVFPMDLGGYIRGDFLSDLTAECHHMATSLQEMQIPHPIPSGNQDAWKGYQAIIEDPRFDEESLLRHKSMVRPGTKLFHRARSVCKLTAEWHPNLATVEGVDIAWPIATVSQYVLDTLDSPFLYESNNVVNDATEQFYAQDDTPNEDAFKRECSWRKQLASYNVHPGRPELGKPRPPKIVYTGWRNIKNLKFTGNFRSALLAVLVSKLNEVKGSQIKKAGERFRKSSGGFDFALTLMMADGVSSQIRLDLRDIIENSGKQDFFEHPHFKKYAEENPSSANRIRQYNRRVQLSQETIELLKVFSEWALGDCLYSVPEYSVILSLFHKPTNKSILTVLQAISILQDENAFVNYPTAFQTLQEANKTLSHYLKTLPNFPPRPVSKALPGFFQELIKNNEYSGIDHVATLNLARQRGCEPGHASILELENYAKLMSEFGLVQ